jgi:Tol biopolymer transport system component
VAYVGRRSAQTDIWKVRLDGDTGLPVDAPVRVIDSSAVDLSPVPLPDNRHFLFVSERDGGRFLYVSDLDGEEIKLIDRSRDWGNVVDVRADGRVILLFYREPTQEDRFRASVLLFDPETREALGPARQLAAGDLLGNLSPDGRYLLRTPTTQPHGLLAFEDPASENPTPLEFPLDADFRARYPNTIWSFFSPDGNWIAFGAYEERHKPAIFVLRVGTETPQLIWEGSGFPRWAADSRRIYAFSERPDDTFGTLGVIDIDPESGAPLSGFQRLHVEPGSGEFVALDHRSTPDGRWLFFVFTEEEGDVYVADLIVK